MAAFAIELKNINKTFGRIAANKNVNLSLKEGEILALLGENGSGKTTLMNMLSGIYRPDSGEIFVRGERVDITSPEDAKKLGIGMVHQHFKLVEDFSAADNIWLGRESQGEKLSERVKTATENKKGFGKYMAAASECGRAVLHTVSEGILKKNRYSEIENISRRLGFEIDAKKKVYNMSVSEKQTLEIIKVLYYGAKVIVLDEPTAVLTVQETEKLFNILRRMKAEGHSIIIITHKLNEVLSLSDRVAVLRKGEYIDTVETATATEQTLTELMVGHKVDLEIERPIIEKKKPLLEIRGLTIKSDEGALAIDDVNFYIRGGEILGVAGIAGCGQRELCEAIAGLRPVESGEIVHKGENIVGLAPKKIIEKGIAMSFIPEDRLGMGLAPSLSVTENMLLKSYNENGFWNPLVDRKRGRAEAEEIIKELSIVTPSTETPVRQLSGGNVQKVLVGREIKVGPNVVVTAYPVRGLDIGSSYMIYDILNRQKKEGVGILFVGEDLDVMLALCDKIMVLCHGRVMGIVHAAKTTKEELGLMMTGALDRTYEDGDRITGIAKDTNIKGGQV